MKNIAKITLLSIITVITALCAACNKAPVRTEKSFPMSTAAGRSSVEVTIYNNDLGLIKERRSVNIGAGMGELRFVDVAAKIDPVTVNIKPLSGAKGFFVLEQNYEYDLISPAKLMEKYVGQKIKIITKNERNDRADTVSATLVSASGGEVYDIGGSIHLGYPGIKVLPELPASLISRPTLSWVYGNSGKGVARDLEVSYLTAGMGWGADYILSVADGAAAGGLSGWVTVRNESGAEYRGARLKLVAGEVNTLPRAYEEAEYEYGLVDAVAKNSAGVGGFAESEVFEYHIYDLDRETDILDNQTKQISLLEAQGVNIRKEYVAEGKRAARGVGASAMLPVAVCLSFKNTKENGLGAPLPAGTVRIYTADAAGAEQFIGEDRIGHTPRDEAVRLKVGEAFDIVVERTSPEMRQVSPTVFETEWRISLRNHKAEGVTVSVVESAAESQWGGGRWEWEVVRASHNHVKVDANTFSFEVAVGAGEEVVLTYWVRGGLRP